MQAFQAKEVDGFNKEGKIQKKHLQKARNLEIIETEIADSCTERRFICGERKG